ncbi:hypothetical protein OG783_05010 [Streptomyces jietaisiensis]|uniref:hypothetical protein n=1 Tax=Streptomyces griseoaurantiacus TaxID=68213 RepID=UPI003250D09C
MSDQNYLPYDEQITDPDYQFEQLDFSTPGLTGPSFLDAPSPPQITAPSLSPAQLAVQEHITNQHTSMVAAYGAWASLPPEERIQPNRKVIAGYAGKSVARNVSETDIEAFVEVHGITDIPEITHQSHHVRVQWPEWHPENHAVPSSLSPEQLEVQARIGSKKTSTTDAYQAWASLPPEQRVRPTAKVVAGHAGLSKATPHWGAIEVFMEAHGITDKPEAIRRENHSISELQWPDWRPENHTAPTANLSADQLTVKALIEKRHNKGVGAYSAWLSLSPERRIEPNRKVIAEFAREKIDKLKSDHIEAFVEAHGITDAFNVVRAANGRMKELQWPKWDPANHIVPSNLSAEQFSAAAEASSSGVSAAPLPPSGIFPPVQDPWLVAEDAEAVTMGTVASPTPYTYGNALPADMDFTHFSHDPSGNDVPNQAFNPAYAAYVAPDAYHYPGQGQQSSIMPPVETRHYAAPSGASDFGYPSMDSNMSVSSWAMPPGYGGHDYNAGASASSSSQNTSSIPPAARGHSGASRRSRRR